LSEPDVSDTIEQVTTHIGFEEFTEDLFGLNIRSGKTIWQSFVAPSEYFEAAQSPDWHQKYTPSLRLWLGLMTVMVALQFFWGKPDGSFMQMMETSVRGGIESSLKTNGTDISLENFNVQGALISVMKFNTLIYPFIFVIFMSFLALIYRAWGQQLPYVVRQRYIFALIVPGTVIGLISTLLMTFLTSTVYQLVSYFQLILILVFYFLTAYRGPYARLSQGNRTGRSIAISACILVMIIIAQTISMIISVFVKLVPALRDYLMQASPPA